MEFLDPEEKRAKTLKLFTSYSIATVAVISITIVLSFVLQGVDLFSRQTDSKNGLLFVDSKPVSANITLDNSPAGKRTDARFVLPEAKYDLKLTAEGYRDWFKQVDVIGGQVRYHVYPKLIPLNIETNNKASYQEEPIIYTQSPDRRWLVISPTKAQTVLHKYDLGNPESSAIQLSYPQSVITKEDLLSSKFEQIEWSNDSKNVLYKKTLKGGKIEFLIINIDKPEESINLSTKLKLTNNTKVTLKDQKYDKYYVLDKQNGLLRAATLNGGLEPKILAENVVEYKYYADDIVMYATRSGTKDGELSIRVIRGGDTFLLEPIKLGSKVLLDIAVYERDWYYVAASDKSEEVLVYFNPLDQTPNIVDGGVIKSQIKLLTKNPLFVSFSDNTRFIAAQSKDEFAVYDGELNKKYRYKSPITLPAEGAKWMDGHRYIAISDGAVQMFEFDGKNKQTLTGAHIPFRAYFDRDYLFMYNIVKNDNGQFGLQQSSLRVES